MDSYQKSFEKRSLDKGAEALPTICMHTMNVMVMMVAILGVPTIMENQMETGIIW